MEIVFDLWEKTPRLSLTVLYEAGLVLAVMSVLAASPGGGPLGIAPVGAALLLLAVLRYRDTATLARACAAGVRSRRWPVAYLVGFAAICVAASAPVAMAMHAALAAGLYAVAYLVALRGDEAELARLPCRWVRMRDHGQEGALFWAFWHLVFWVAMVLVAVQDAPVIYLVAVGVGAPLVTKLIDMTYLLKLWADDVAHR
ncbi:hypothetical protein [Pseudaestuariivita atlantica]|uniref:Uncharacterized protein n=1 Tax=Pseudaestuariivita atlantica TaxID=1317121 RepID=A0A0L1JSV2_9RHOB|nr:hypothetical protein [Pseudaestuariivita atlantica]KNG94830.1 hypothetical protein ATO11_05445 [Pseudaestuariivita atlantica]